MDRFMMKLVVSYPKKTEEKKIIERMTQSQLPTVRAVATAQDILRLRDVIRSIYVDEKVKDYVLDIVYATREPEAYNLGSLKNLIQFGASPRASIASISAVVASRTAFITSSQLLRPAVYCGR